MTTKNLSALSALLFTFVLLIGCGQLANPIAPTTVSAQSSFGGLYLFRAEKHSLASPFPNFVEGGILTVDSIGGFTLLATYNATPLDTVPASPIVSPNVSIAGSYTFDNRGFGIMTASGASDAFSSPAHVYCLGDGSYCTIASAETSRVWQGKMWRDDSAASMRDMAGTHIFESDSSQNLFIESGVMIFDSAGKFTLQSTFNNILPGSIIQPPDVIWGCGEYSFAHRIGHLTQRFCHDNSVTDTAAMYCFGDASRCVFVPDLNEPGFWILETQRR